MYKCRLLGSSKAPGRGGPSQHPRSFHISFRACCDPVPRGSGLLSRVLWAVLLNQDNCRSSDTVWSWSRLEI